MTSAHIIEPGDADRTDVQAFIAAVYGREYGAKLTSFADTLICRVDARGEILCAAGLRTASDGFFSEQYLATPVETALARATGRRVHRQEVFEVTTLASRSPREIGAFIGDIIAYGARNGMAWSFFTLTRRLSLLLKRRHLSPVFLADADARRVADPLAWGRYYETEPKVFAVDGLKLASSPVASLELERHAELP